MRIDGERLRNLRTDANWTQDELATAAALTLRTVQRMENGGRTSLQSLKSVAAALNVPSEELEYHPMTTYEYNFLEIPVRSGKKLNKQGLPSAIDSVLNSAGTDGWRLRQLVIPSYEGPWGVRSDCVVAVLERQVTT